MSSSLQDYPYGIDRAFKDFFRIGGFDFDQEIDEVIEQSLQDPTITQAQVLEKLPLDRLSLLACDRQGLQPVELLLQGDNRSKSVPQATPRSGVAALKRIMEAKQEASAFRRMGKIRVAEAERRTIVAILIGVDSSAATIRKSEKLSKDENALLVQLRSQDVQAVRHVPGAHLLSPEELADYSFPCNDAAEADACDALLQWQSAADIQDKKHKAHMAKVQKAAAAEFERMKAIQHRSAVAEVVDVLQRNAMEEKMRHKEQSHREFVEQREAQRRQESKEAEQDRNRKRQLCTQRFRETLRTRRHELAAKSQHRDERSQAVQNERDQELAQRHARKEEIALNAKKRCDAVNESIVEYRSVLEDELAARMELHESNQTQQQLRKRAAHDLKAARDRIRAEAIDHLNASNFEKQIERETEAIAKEQEIERRKEAVKQAALTRSKILAAQSDAAHKNSLKLCEKELRDREERRKLLELEYEAKSEQVRAAEEHRKVDRIIKAELVAQRVENHEQNRLRVEKSMAYQQKLKSEIVAKEEERDRQQRAAQERHKKDMTSLATQLYKEREQLARTLELSKTKFATMGLSDIVDANEAGSEKSSETGSLRRRTSFGPSKASILRQAELITSKYMSPDHSQQTSVSRSAIRSRPMSASLPQHPHRVVDSVPYDATTTVSSMPEEQAVTTPLKVAPRRPLSAVTRRTPVGVDMSSQQTALRPTNQNQLGPAFHHSPVVRRQLAEVDELDDSALETEERRRCGGTAVARTTTKKSAHVQLPATPLAELVQRMDTLYHS
ncbi:Hypothetical protein, putative [Bodo saltans]|uniref:Uncharacterized protein n=1 Tax=Bodo saltans TaxID=75058 RepID=A0A0S4KHV6_BODSA|nr:Hypothetical protein, putative [Bodo saltans]|eukprot:CUI15273.1 Hypothetical protein, putative [Bodo saltans]